MENSVIFAKLQGFELKNMEGKPFKQYKIRKILENNSEKCFFLRIYDLYLIYCKNLDFLNCKICYFDSENLYIHFHYEFSELNSISIKIKYMELIKLNKKFKFISEDESNISIKSEIKSKINQLGFHDYFFPIKKIGKGAFGYVYLANCKFNNFNYAIKALSKQKLQFKENLPAFKNEIKILRFLNHPNLIKLDSVYETSNTFYLIFDFFPGGNLINYIKKNENLSNIEKKLIIKSILKGINYLHENHIIHRDIKPENILLRCSENLCENDIVIADFGLATFEKEKIFLFNKCGTPGFVAPEIANLIHSDNCNLLLYNNKCDLFSLGITFYFVMMNDLPYKKDGTNIFIKNKEMKFDFDEKIINLENDAKDIFFKMIEKDPELRISAKKALMHNYFLINDSFEINNSFLFENDIENIGFCNPNANLSNFNKRKIDFSSINSLSTSPVSSPLRKYSEKIKQKSKDLNLSPNFKSINDEKNNSFSLITGKTCFLGNTVSFKSIFMNGEEELKNSESFELNLISIKNKN